MYLDTKASKTMTKTVSQQERFLHLRINTLPQTFRTKQDSTYPVLALRTKKTKARAK